MKGHKDILLFVSSPVCCGIEKDQMRDRRSHEGEHKSSPSCPMTWFHYCEGTGPVLKSFPVLTGVSELPGSRCHGTEILTGDPGR